MPVQPFRSSPAQREAIADHSYRQSKSEKIDEWAGCSLATDYDRLAWWQRKSEVTGSTVTAPPATVTNLPEPDKVGFEYQQIEQLDALQSEEALSPHNQNVPDTNATSATMLLPPQIENVAPVEDVSVATSEQWRRYF